jgi:4-hydroxybenzoate polyprenyltransferase
MTLQKNLVSSLFRASHFGPTVLVVSVSFLLSLSQFSFFKSLEIAIAILAGQFVVGWSNDLIDYPLDKAAARLTKPLVSGEISQALLKKCIALAVFAALIFSLVGPLGATGTGIHFLGLLSATLYNLRLKRTVLSPIPYIFSFGAMPWAVYEAAGKLPPTWIYLGFALFATAFHFLNILKDMDFDIAQGVLGLPQRIGRRASISVAIVLVAAGFVDIYLRP